MGVLIEHTAGKWPFWLSPRQIVVCPVSERHVNHAKFIAELLMREEIRVANGSQNESKLFEDTSLFVDVDDSARTVNKKVRDAQVSSYNLIVVVGDTEVEKGNLAMRFRDAATYLSFIEARNSILNTPKETNEFTSSPILPTTTTKVLSEDSVIPEKRKEWKSPLVTISSVEELRSICRRMMLLRI